jgi:cyclic pyranopterin phosphate synthase
MAARKKLSHVGPRGTARMVDVGAKPSTARRARAAGEIRMSKEAWTLVKRNAAAKGDVLGVAKLAGIQAAKRTAELIPLCHPLALSHVDVTLTLVASPPAIRVVSDVRTTGQTGVEMEALVAASIALLTVYDMVKAADKRMRIGKVRLVYKSGGKSGLFTGR